MNIILEEVTPASAKYAAKIFQYRDDMINNGEEYVNGSSGLKYYPNFAEWYKGITNPYKYASTEDDNTPIPSTQYLAFSKDGSLVGMIDLQHKLNDFLLGIGGQIGYSVHPSFRGRGYATEMLKQVIIISRDKLGLEKVLVCCDKHNHASAKVITNNGGILDNEVIDSSDGCIVQRYWIDTHKV